MLEVLRVDFYHVRWIWAVYVLTLVGISGALLIADLQNPNVQASLSIGYIVLAVATCYVCYRLHCEDRHPGTLGFLLSQPFSRSQLHWLRVIFSVMLLYIPLLIGLLPFLPDMFRNGGVVPKLALSWSSTLKTVLAVSFIYLGMAPLYGTVARRGTDLGFLLLITPLGVAYLCIILMGKVPLVSDNPVSYRYLFLGLCAWVMIISLIVSDLLWQRAEVR